MFNQSGGYSIADIAAVTDKNGNCGNGWGYGGGDWWIAILFLLFGFGGWGNGGWGGNGNNVGLQGALTRSDLMYGFDMNGLQSAVRGVQNGVCDGFYAQNTNILNGFAGVNSALCQGFSGVNSNITNTGYEIIQGINNNTVAGMQNTNAITQQLNNMSAQNASCCCETQRLIEKAFCDLNYNLATQACDTRRAITDSTRELKDFWTQDKIATLTAENQTLKLDKSQSNQNDYITALINSAVAKLTPPQPVPSWEVNPPYAYAGYRGGCGNQCCNY